MQGSAAFFAPLMRTVPRSGSPPRITNLSIGNPWSDCNGIWGEDWLIEMEPEDRYWRHRQTEAGHRDARRNLSSYRSTRRPRAVLPGLFSRCRNCLADVA